MGNVELDPNGTAWLDTTRRDAFALAQRHDTGPSATNPGVDVQGGLAISIIYLADVLRMALLEEG